MNRVIIPFFLVLLVASGVVVRAQDDEVIRVETRLVSVPVIVSDRDGHYVPGLTQKDFGILQDGVAQPIEFFAANDEPLTVAILVDTSRSTRLILDDIKDAAAAFIKLLGPADKAMVVTFDHDVRVLTELTTDHDKLLHAVKNAEIPEKTGTILRTAVDQTVFKSFEGLSGRKAVIVLTDGEDGGSNASHQSLLLKLQETDTLIYTIQFRTVDKRMQDQMLRRGTITAGMRNQQANNNARADAAGEFLRLMSMVTAGRAYSVESVKLKETFLAILDELRRQYRLGFYPAEGVSDDKLHEVKVRIARPNLIVRARGSYRLLQPPH